MMGDRFSRSLAFVRRFEGGYVDHAADPGGATKEGISLRFLRAIGFDVNGDGQIDPADIRALSAEDIIKLYRTRFWDPMGCSELPSGVDLLVFDAAVNQGPGFAARALQKVVAAKADGVVGPKTLAAAAAHDPIWLADRIAVARALRYARNPKVLVFGRGWFRRLLACHFEAVLDTAFLCRECRSRPAS